MRSENAENWKISTTALDYSLIDDSRAYAEMFTYHSYSDLVGSQLQRDDHVIFEHNGFVIEYIVHRYNLYEINDNYYIQNKIFQLLGLDPFDFCKQHYNELYDNWERDNRKYPNLWPLYCEDDYGSATKVVLELFRLIEEPERLKETSEILFID